MDISGEYRLRAPRQKVWEALNDPDFIQRALPGCQSMEKVSDTEFTAKVNSKIGPVKATFNSKVSLTDLNPPESYRLVGEGKGGAAGFAKGSADVHLTEEGEETVLRYNSDLQVGGKLAQIGNRLVGGAAKKTADEFFSNFANLINEPAPAAAEPAAVSPAAEAPAPGAAEPVATDGGPAPATGPTPAPTPPTSQAPPGGLFSTMSPALWIAVAVVVVVLLWIIF